MSDTLQTTEPVPPVPPYGDDDEPEFSPRPRKRAHPLTYVLVALVVLAGGFLGGVAYQKHEGGSSSSSSASSALAAFAARRGAAGGTGTGAATGGGTGGGAAGGRFGGATIGTVKLVDGRNIYVTDTSGNIVKVTTSDASQLSKTDPATTKDIAPGQTVVVRGTTNADGSVTATAVTATPAGSGGGGFGGVTGG